MCELATVIGSLVQGNATYKSIEVYHFNIGYNKICLDRVIKQLSHCLLLLKIKEYSYIFVGVPEAVDQLIQCGGLILLLKGRICYFKINAVRLS